MENIQDSHQSSLVRMSLQMHPKVTEKCQKNPRAMLNVKFQNGTIRKR